MNASLFIYILFPVAIVVLAAAGAYMLRYDDPKHAPTASAELKHDDVEAKLSDISELYKTQWQSDLEFRVAEQLKNTPAQDKPSFVVDTLSLDVDKQFAEQIFQKLKDTAVARHGTGNLSSSTNDFVPHLEKSGLPVSRAWVLSDDIKKEIKEQVKKATQAKSIT